MPYLSVDVLVVTVGPGFFQGIGHKVCQVDREQRKDNHAGYR